MGRRTSYLILFLFLGFAAKIDLLSAQSTTESEDNITNKIPPEEVEKVFKELQNTTAERDDLDRRLTRRGRVIESTDKHPDPNLMQDSKIRPKVHALERGQLTFEKATDALVENYNLSTDEVAYDLPRYPVSGEQYQANQDACTMNLPEPDCDENSKFRTANGECNNLNNPTWGMAFECQRRMMPPSYVGASGYRQSVSGSPLPAPRNLSLNLHFHVNRPTNDVTHMYMFFGQLLDHDFAFTPVSTTIDNLPIECCPATNETHPQCDPILIEADDYFYSQFGINCTNFVRSALCPTCTLGYRHQISSVTSFIDASFVYGNSENTTGSLRENDGTGRLIVERSNFGDLLPPSNPNEDQCSYPETNDTCFLSGDARGNQHTVLASLHTIFMREHNRIAGKLRRINPQWDEERLFQETRRIVGAETQVIVYKEYLHITLGQKTMDRFQLWISDDSDTTDYDSEVDPTLTTEFSTSAFRFGHSLINSVVAKSPLNATNELRLLRNEFIQPFDLRNGIIGPLMEGASCSSAQKFDRHLVEDVTNFLYRTRGEDAGLDLAALNINRGRDHGLPPYVDMVRYCTKGKIQIRKFSDLYKKQKNQKNPLMTRQYAQALKENYEYVDDVDSWPGILMEIPYDDAVVGPTGACVMGLYFNRLKFGDRFYFEHENQTGSFSNPQLRELRKVSLSTIICLNSNATELPSNPMLFSNENNPVVKCKNVRQIDLSYWKE